MDDFLRKYEGDSPAVLLTKEEIQSYVDSLSDLIATEEFRDSLRSREYHKKFDQAITEIIYWNRIIAKYLL